MLFIDAKNVNKSFDSKNSKKNVAVLKDISMEVAEGEVVTIIGPSGSGKSTFLRCLTTLETADSGQINICGKDMFKSDGVLSDKETIHEIILDVGLVFQNFELFPHMSVLENLIHPSMNVLGVDRSIAAMNAEKLLDIVNMLVKRHEYPCNLSGGQKQRVAICRALTLKPKILFFDEPTSALDPELTGEILRIIKLLAKEKMTMVIVTHEMAFAHEVSDKVIFMDNGIIIEQGTPEEVFENTKSQRAQLFLKKLNKII